MANHKSAWKRIRQSEVRRLRNRKVRKQLTTMLKSVRSATNREEGEQKLRIATSALDKAAVNGLIHRNKAANQKSKLTRLVASL